MKVQVLPSVPMNTKYVIPAIRMAIDLYAKDINWHRWIDGPPRDREDMYTYYYTLQFLLAALERGEYTLPEVTAEDMVRFLVNSKNVAPPT